MTKENTNTENNVSNCSNIGELANTVFMPPEALSPYTYSLEIGEICSGDLPPLPSRAMRRIARRSKSSSRGGIVVQLPNWQRSRIVLFESRLELRVLFLLLARGDLIDLWEQPPSISYRDKHGNRRTHFFDFLIRLSSGRRVAIAVKPAKRAMRIEFVRELRCIRRAMSKDFADDLILITDQDFTMAEALNAERYHEFSRSRNEMGIERLRYAIRSMSFPTSVAELARSLDAGDQSFRTIFIAIYEGLLSVDRTMLIDTDTALFLGAVQ
jgi:hypothetical protein